VAALLTSDIGRLTAAAPCGPLRTKETTLLTPPTNLRLVDDRGLSISREQDTASARDEQDTFSTRQVSGANAYFDSLVSRADCYAAYDLRSQAQLDSLPTANKHSPKKKAIEYDRGQDAAKITIHAPTSTDIKGKLLPLHISTGTMLITWDFKFDEGFRWRQEHNMIRHKTWRLEAAGGPGGVNWLQLRTDYRHAASVGKFVEAFVVLQGDRYLAPGTKVGAPAWHGEQLQPQRAQFFMNPDVWTRWYLFVDGIDQKPCHFSAWMADENRDPVQLHDRIPLYCPQEEFTRFRIEYDTSADQGSNPNEAHAWERNYVVLHNIRAADVTALLKRPTK
jgi:hypothetical protein